MNMMIEVKGSDTLPQTETVTPSVPQSTAPTLASSAMLVEVNISNWVGRKKDKRASADVTTQNHAEVQEKYSEFYAKQYNTAMNDVWTRLHKALTSMSERLDYGSKEDKKVFRDSLVGNVNDMIELLRVCNVTNSSQMSAMANSLEEAMSGVTPDALREDDTFRAETKAAVDAAIKSLPSLDI